MTNIPISKWTKEVSASVQVTDPVWKAWRAMKDYDVKILPVSSGGRIVGIVSSQDIVRASDHNGGQSMSVKEAMSLDPIVVNRSTSVVNVVYKMIEKDQQHSVVVDDDSNIVGIFSWSEVFLFFLEQNEIEFPISQGRFK